MFYVAVRWMVRLSCCFFFNDTATTEIYTLSLHDALPIWIVGLKVRDLYEVPAAAIVLTAHRELEKLVNTIHQNNFKPRSEEHTSELQSRQHLVCRLLLEKNRITTDDMRLLPNTNHSPY